MKCEKYSWATSVLDDGIMRFEKMHHDINGFRVDSIIAEKLRERKSAGSPQPVLR